MILSVGGNEVAITSPTCYLISIGVFVVLIRVILAFFKVWAMKDGEHRPDMDKPDPITNYSFKNLFWIGFTGLVGNANTRDYLLPAVIGFAELAAYPVLFKANQLSVIGAWLALKTAGQWSVWKTSRTAFNRFLLGNLLTIGLSYLWLSTLLTVAYCHD